ncbi:Hypothetical predicted protein [Mytilus galloprovincialis]|uniref:SMB domain-containing protein n=1 Tax=Mytilus galloprovincialis TaxID=29158 RepID=A0A8B6F7X2_MYTGA|nr:Hypothetical predicted protein [Mytilus galloprovincialis]
MDRQLSLIFFLFNLILRILFVNAGLWLGGYQIPNTAKTPDVTEYEQHTTTMQEINPPDKNSATGAVPVEFSDMLDNILLSIVDDKPMEPPESITHDNTVDNGGLLTTDMVNCTMKQYDMFTNDPCKTYATCQFLESINTKYCRCDEACHIFNDCCYPKKQSNQSQTLDRSLYECKQISSDKSDEGIQVISTCPDRDLTVTPDLDLLCQMEDIKEVGPWVYDHQGRVYSNKYCRQCNGQKKFNMSPMLFTSILIGLIDQMNGMTPTERVSLLLDSPSVSREYALSLSLSDLRYCVSSLEVSSLPGCHNYSINPVLILGWKLYKNYYCIPQADMDIDDRPVCYGTRFIDNIGLLPIISYSTLKLLVNFTENSSTDKLCLNETSGFCNLDEAYYDYTQLLDVSFIANDTLSTDLWRQILQAWVHSLQIDSAVVEWMDAANHTTMENGNMRLSWVTIDIRLTKKMTYEKLIENRKLLAKVTWEITVKTKDKIIKIKTAEADKNFKFNNWHSLIHLGEMPKDIHSVSVYGYEFPCENTRIDSTLVEDFMGQFILIDNVTCLDESIPLEMITELVTQPEKEGVSTNDITDISIIDQQEQNVKDERGTSSTTSLSYKPCSLLLILFVFKLL